MTHEHIVTRCPSCGHQTLFIGDGGHLTCSWLQCREPGVERRIDALIEAEKRVESEAFRSRLVSLFKNAADDPQLSDREVRNIVRYVSGDPITDADVKRSHELAAQFGWPLV